MHEVRNAAQRDSWDADLIGLELCVELGGDLRLTELYADR
jgi:hypothetical protein